MKPVARIAYADPPYPGCAHLYEDHPDFAGEVDHAALVRKLETEFDGWILHTNSVSIPLLASLVPSSVRWGAWVKSFAAYKRNVSVAYAWEPVIIKAVRKPIVSGRCVMRDWIKCPITLKRGLTGAKPEAVCRWAFELVGAHSSDELVDLYPGSGAVTQAWNNWRRQFRFEFIE